MGLISNFVLTIFIVSALLLIFLVLIQDDQGEGIGGLFGGGASAFRSRSGNLLQYITATVVVFFFIGAIGYALLTRPVDPIAQLSNQTIEGIFLENILEEEENLTAPATNDWTLSNEIFSTITDTGGIE